jgi:hypothetical protein
MYELAKAGTEEPGGSLSGGFVNDAHELLRQQEEAKAKKNKKGEESILCAFIGVTNFNYQQISFSIRNTIGSSAMGHGVRMEMTSLLNRIIVSPLSRNIVLILPDYGSTIT